MKFASYQDGSRDGQLVVVSRDLGLAVYPSHIANRLQQVLDDWNYLSPQLQDLSDQLNAGRARNAFAFNPAQCLAPLPRAYQWAHGGGFGSHAELLGQAQALDADGAEAQPTGLVQASSENAIRLPQQSVTRGPLGDSVLVVGADNKPVPRKIKDHIALAKVTGYQSLHTTLVGPAGINVEFQMRTESMHLVAESGVAAHWLYKTNNPQDSGNERLGTQWLQSLLDIQDETRDASEFWEHVKVDLFPDAVYVFTPKSQIMAMPRGATVVDFAYSIHSNVGDRTMAARINGEQVPLRTTLKNGDVVEVVTAPGATPNPAWLSFVRTGRARSKIRHHLKTMQLTESEELGSKLLAQALRAEGIESFPDPQTHAPVWDKLLRFTGSKTRQELLTDIGLGKRIANIVAKRLVLLLGDVGERPDALLLTRERFGASNANGMGSLTLDGSENASVKFALCCRPIPGDSILGYLGRGEGLVVHAADCPVATRLQHKDGERFMGVEWADELTRPFEVDLAVTVANGKGVMAQVASALSTSEADIVHIEMAPDSAQDVKELHFVIAIRDRAHLDVVLAKLQRSPVVMRAQRSKKAI